MKSLLRMKKTSTSIAQSRIEKIFNHLNPSASSNKLKCGIQLHFSPTSKHYSSPSSSYFFGDITQAPPDSILGLNVAFKNDTHPDKVNVGVGAFRDNEGKPYVLKCIREVEKRLFHGLETNPQSPQFNKEYSPQQGTPEFRKLTQKLILGTESDRVATLQSLSGTGALRLGVEFIKKFFPKDTAFYLPKPTWGNHQQILKYAGYGDTQIRDYRYINNKDMSLDFEGLVADLKNAPSGSVFLLHVCAHNPTGVDPTHDQWKQIYEIMRERRLIPFFDSAYQGFASGDLDKDGFAVRYFYEKNIEFLCAQSFAKNLGLYGERIGAIHLVCKSKEIADAVLSQAAVVVRTIYSNPPLHGARLVEGVLSDPQLYNTWKEEMKYMSSRIMQMRKALYEELHQLKTPHPSGDPSRAGNWKHITDQIGMFSYTGLTPKQCDRMINKWHIYLTKNGRISIAGLTTKNVQYVAKAIHDCVLNEK